MPLQRREVLPTTIVDCLLLLEYATVSPTPLCFCCAFAFALTCFAVLLSLAILDQRLWSCGHLVLRPALAALLSPYSGARAKSMEYKYSMEHALQIMAACYVTTTKVAAESSISSHHQHLTFTFCSRELLVRKLPESAPASSSRSR